MSSESYNLRNPAVKRLMKEALELREATELYAARPLEDNLFEWHFTVRGPPDTDFQGGLYHGRISLPPTYPMKPPTIILLTPNGRFELNKKICLSISGHHPESWQPSWSIRTALLAIVGFMPSHGGGAIGSLDYPSSERKRLAARSKDFVCAQCGLRLADALPPLTEASAGQAQEASALAAQIAFSPPPTADEALKRGKAESEDAAPADQASSQDPVPNQRSEPEEATDGLRQRTVPAASAPSPPQPRTGTAVLGVGGSGAAGAAGSGRGGVTAGSVGYFVALFLITFAIVSLLTRRLLRTLA